MSLMTNKAPYRQIRAHQPTPDTIIVYQAYRRSIAEPAVAQQKLDASPDFNISRMTWIKPSWAWMLYRAGYSYKDKGQECILALTMRTEHFVSLLERGVLSHGTKKVWADGSGGEGVEAPGAGAGAGAGAESGQKVREVTDNITEGIGKDMQQTTKKQRQRNRKETGEERGKTEDVRVQWDPERTYRLNKLEYRSIQIGIPAALSKQWATDWIIKIEDVTERARKLKKVLDETPDVSDEELVGMGLLPVETVFEVPVSVRGRLQMDEAN